jgi:hypothetical protein
MFGGRLGVPELLVIFLVFSVVTVPMGVAWWKIFTKAGHPGILGLAMMVPFVKFFLLLWFAFADWPIQKGLAPDP